jgi:hypothetical protein
MRIIFLVLNLFFLPLFLFAQGKGQFSGKLTDSSGKKQIPYATVTVFTSTDTTIVTYRLSDDDGKFKVPGLPLNHALRAVITASGYEVWRKEFTLTADSSQMDMGTVKMNIQIQELDEVLVIAERPPVVYRKDTIEFNASAFKTLPTALVEDLLKKFPGVDIDKEGNITVNGRKANKMLVDSKEFFGTDPKIASKNLPANIIDKVQISDDKEEMQRNPDLSAAEVGVVINLKLKRSIKQGWFGKVYAGAGTDERYELGGIVNLFRDTLQVSVLGFSNNLNRSGFSISDVMSVGGFSRSNVNSIMINSDGGFALNDISFGGLGQGIVRSSGGGINTNTILSKKITLSLQYFYGRNNTRVFERSNTQQFFNDTTLTTRNTSSGGNDDYSHRVSGFMRWKVDSLTTIDYRPSFTFTKGRNQRLSESSSISNYEGQLNESVNEQRTSTDGFSLGQELSYSRSFRKAGRSLYSTISMQLNSNDISQYNDAENIFYKTSTPSSLNQLRSQDQNNMNGRLYINYNEPVSKALSLRFTQTLELFQNKDFIDTYEFDPATNKYIIPNEDLTNGLKRNGLRSSSYAGLQYKYKKFSITPGMTLRALNIDNTFRKNPDLNQHFLYLLPALAVKFNKWNFNYTVNVTEPSATDLQPVVNNTNPLFLQLGNPSLKPTLAHSININSYFYDVKQSLNYNFYLSGTINNNAVIRERIVDENGVQISRPINANGVWRTYASGSVRKQYKFSQKWKFSAGLSMYVQYNQGLVLVNQNRSVSKNWNLNPGFNWSFNWDDKFELNQRYGPSWTKSFYESNVYPSLQIWRHTASSELVVRLPKHWVWESSLDYNYNPQVAEGIAKSAFRWNAAVNFLFLKDDKGQFKLSVYDLLNQNISVVRTVQENYIRDAETMVLQRYFLLTFTYNIRNFKAKVGGRERMMMF